MLRYVIILISFLLIPLSSSAQSDSEKLGMALDYFQSHKYHEALLMFEDLDKHYQLNPRFLAYMGVCYYYAWNYEKATAYLDSIMEKMDVYSPHERAVYYYADAESHFYLQQFDKAIPMYEQMLKVCYKDEEPATHYKLGFCYLFQDQWQEASDLFKKALSGYKKMLPMESARISQLHNMINGLHALIPPSKEDWLRFDSLWRAINSPKMVLNKNYDLPPLRKIDLPTLIHKRKADPAIASTRVVKDTISHSAVHDIDLGDIYRDIFIPDSIVMKNTLSK